MCPKEILPNPEELRSLAYEVADLGRASGMASRFDIGMTKGQCSLLSWMSEWVTTYTQDQWCFYALDEIHLAFCGPIRYRSIDSLQRTFPSLPMVVHQIHCAAKWVEIEQAIRSGAIIPLRPNKKKGGWHE